MQVCHNITGILISHRYRMKIGGLAKNSFVDYPGKIAAVIFAVGCNYDCWYCHNRGLLTETEHLDNNEVLDFLYKRRGQLDAVVFSGGEVCMQQGLIEMMSEVKDMGYLIKLDTNGAYPSVLQELLDKELLDYIAMDIKAPLDKYKIAACMDADTAALCESIKLIMNCGVDYEFRTTCIPQLAVADIEDIAKTIAGARLYALQQYRHQPEGKVIGMKYKPHEKQFFIDAKAAAEKYVGKVVLRGV